MHAITSLLAGRSPFAGRDRVAPRPRCAACGRTVGMFGPAWIEHSDGIIEPATWHTLSEQSRPSISRAFHAGCVIPDYLPAWMDPTGTAAERQTPCGSSHRSFRLTATPWNAASRMAAATLSLGCAAIAALDAATIVLYAAPR